MCFLHLALEVNVPPAHTHYFNPHQAVDGPGHSDSVWCFLFLCATTSPTLKKEEIVSFSAFFPFFTLVTSAWNNIYSVLVKCMKHSWFDAHLSCFHWFLLFWKAPSTLSALIEHTNQPRTISGKYLESLEGSPVWRCVCNLPGRLSEWVRGRHKPAIHETLCTDLVIKPQCVGSTRKQRRKAGKTNAPADFAQARCHSKTGSLKAKVSPI